MVKAKKNTIVRVTVTSKAPEFKDLPVIQKLVDKSVTWDSFLRNHGIELDPDVHYLSALSGSVRALAQHKVSDIVDKYRKIRGSCSVQILRSFRTVAMLSHQIGDSEVSEDVEMPRGSQGRKRKRVRHFGEEEESEEVGDHAEDEDVDYEDPLEDPLEVPSSSVAGPEPDHYNMPPSHSYSGAYGGGLNFDRTDVASVASKDTFDADIGEDIKGVTIEKLRHWATNGDLYRIREELRELQANRKSLKVARYIPYTMNVLGVLFGSS